MDLIGQIALAAVLAWASGIRFYAAVFVFGWLGRLGWVDLPQSLELITHSYVLLASGVMLVGEFLADKIPAFDSLWDALHTFIRIPGGMALAWGALGDQGPAAQFAAAMVGGAITSGTHLAKAGTRVALNHSPEPFSNWIASFSEDGLFLACVWLALTHPWLFLALMVLFLALLVWLLPKLLRVLRWLFLRLFGTEARQAT